MADYWTEVAADAPVLQYRFTETAGTTLTSSVGATDATLVGSGYTLNSAGPKGIRAIDFTGGATISVPIGFSGFGPQSWTYEAWAKFPVAMDVVTYPTIIRRDGNGMATLMRGRGQNVGASFSPYKAEFYSGNIGNYSGIAINDNQWHHWAMTRNANSMIGYIDGVQVVASGSEPVIQSWFGGSQSFGIGGNGALNVDENFTGSIAAPTFYSVALSPTRIAAHANADVVAGPAVPFTGWGIPL